MEPGWDWWVLGRSGAVAHAMPLTSTPSPVCGSRVRYSHAWVPDPGFPRCEACLAALPGDHPTVVVGSTT